MPNKKTNGGKNHNAWVKPASEPNREHNLDLFKSCTPFTSQANNCAAVYPPKRLSAKLPYARRKEYKK